MIDALILWCHDLPACVTFYRALGLPLAPDEHDPGGESTHFECDVDGVHVGLFAGEAGRARTRGEAGGTQPSVRVASLDAARAAMVALGARILIDTQDGPWGVRIVVEDPDGRPVQITSPAG